MTNEKFCQAKRQEIISRTVNDMKPLGKQQEYIYRNGRWLMPLIFSFIVLSTAGLQEVIGAELPFLIPQWLIFTGLIIGGVSFVYGVITTDTVSALIVGKLLVAMILAAVIYFIIRSLRVIIFN